MACISFSFTYQVLHTVYLVTRIVQFLDSYKTTDQTNLESVEQRVVYSIYYKGTLVLPGRGERGVAFS